MRELVIDGTRIADDEECYVIAEIGHNHQGSVAKCKELFDAARWAGANAVKLQKRHNKTLYSQAFYDSPYQNENSFGATYGAHREALEFGRRDYELLKCYAEAIGLTFFATAFDIPSANFLDEIGVCAFKIASGDVGNTLPNGYVGNKPLIKHVATFRKPVIISTGGGELVHTEFASGWLGNCPHAILQCTSGYPAKYEELNLKVVETYRARFPNTVIGYSGHDNGIAMSVIAYTLGARIIEKHFTLDRSAKGTDQAFSLEPAGLRKLVRDLRRARSALGDGIKRRYASEDAALAKQEKNDQGQVDGGYSAQRRSEVSPAIINGGAPMGQRRTDTRCPGVVHAKANHDEGVC